MVNQKRGMGRGGGITKRRGSYRRGPTLLEENYLEFVRDRFVSYERVKLVGLIPFSRMVGSYPMCRMLLMLASWPTKTEHILPSTLVSYSNVTCEVLRLG